MIDRRIFLSLPPLILFFYFHHLAFFSSFLLQTFRRGVGGLGQPFLKDLRRGEDISSNEKDDEEEEEEEEDEDEGRPVITLDDLPGPSYGTTSTTPTYNYNNSNNATSHNKQTTNNKTSTGSGVYPSSHPHSHPTLVPSTSGRGGVGTGTDSPLSPMIRRSIEGDNLTPSQPPPNTPLAPPNPFQPSLTLSILNPGAESLYLNPLSPPPHPFHSYLFH